MTIRRFAHLAALFVLLTEAHAETVDATAAAQPALTPLTPEIAVWSGGQLTGAPRTQSNPLIGVNGEIALVVWSDTRDTNGVYWTYATRVDRNGRALDPGGVKVAMGQPRGVVWNGEAFAVVTHKEMSFVAPDMTVTRKPRELSWEYQLEATKPGPDARFLFLAPPFGMVAVLNGRGDIVSQRSISNPDLFGFSIATALDDGFMVLTSRAGKPPTANRLSGNGDLLSSLPTGLPFSIDRTVMDGDDRGLLVVHRESTSPVDVIAYRLDASGVFTGRSVKLVHQQSVAAAALMKDGDRYIVAWDEYLASLGRAAQFVASVDVDDALNVYKMGEWNGYGRDIAVALTAGGTLIADSAERKPPAANEADVFVRLVADWEQPSESRLITATLPEQENVGIAAAANGYAVVWVETGADAISRLLLRRFSPIGLPLDPAPIEVVSVPYAGTSIFAPRIVSNGETYLLAWGQRTSRSYYIRRLAASGEWIDAEPMLLQANGSFDLASNGTDAMALWSDYVTASDTYALRARRIAMSGPALASPSVELRGPTKDHSMYYLAIESNGTDYLAGWFESVRCLACSGLPQWMYVTRLRADGTALDAPPLTLQTTTAGLSGDPIIAASDRLYFIAYYSPDGLRGTRITAEGAVLDRDSGGHPSLLPSYGYQWASAAGLQNQFVLLLMSYSTNFATQEITTFLEAATSVANDLPNTWPRTQLIGQADRLRRMPAIAVRNGVMALAYQRLAPEGGDVQRAFLRLFALPVPRRHAAGR